jgi:hypothetical protein
MSTCIVYPLLYFFLHINNVIVYNKTGVFCIQFVYRMTGRLKVMDTLGWTLNIFLTTEKQSMRYKYTLFFFKAGRSNEFFF